MISPEQFALQGSDHDDGVDDNDDKQCRLLRRFYTVANSHTAPLSAQHQLRQLRNDGIQLSHRQQTELLLCSRHHRNLHIAAADLFLHDLLERGQRQDLCLCHRHALVVLILQVRLCAFAAAADGFGVIARECAGWVSLVQAGAVLVNAWGRGGVDEEFATREVSMGKKGSR